jgi:uncharacterized protein YjiS (DUF1127 family)
MDLPAYTKWDKSQLIFHLFWKAIMKQTIFTYYHPYSGEIAVSTAIHEFFARAAAILDIWRQRIKQRNALTELNTRLLADIGISEAQRLAEISKPFWRA